MTRVTITLNAPVAAALWKSAERDYRDPRQQAALFVQRELERLGLLATDAKAQREAVPA